MGSFVSGSGQVSHKHLKFSVRSICLREYIWAFWMLMDLGPEADEKLAIGFGDRDSRSLPGGRHWKL
jgi:hypothetical protein